jgi:hypothetical protein
MGNANHGNTTPMNTNKPAENMKPANTNMATPKKP